ncbi:MAG TPA: hypothetical protein PK728_06860 [Bacillota bacterium]|nr:hypothetical protein [Bacillota bacterium]
MSEDEKDVKESGYAMLMVIMTAVVLFLLGTALLSAAANSKKDSISFKEQMQALYIAEAGVEKALAKTVSDRKWLEESPSPCLLDIPLAGGRIVYTKIEKQAISGGYLLTVESRGRFGASNRTVVVTARVVERQDEGGAGGNFEITVVSWMEKYGVF